MQLTLPEDTMRAVVIDHPGGPEVLKLREVPDPVPAADEVLIAITAAGVNRADLSQREGSYPPPPGAPPYPGMECAGRIAAVGSEITGWQPGDAVCALLAGGGYAEQVAVPAGQVLPIPAGLALADAAALPEVACTVYSTVVTYAGLAPGETLLVHGGSSGIGTMAIQLGHALGATVACTAGWRPSWSGAASSARTWPSTTGTRTSPQLCSSSPAAAARMSSWTSSAAAISGRT